MKGGGLMATNDGLEGTTATASGRLPVASCR
jgi:hypothetical protein